MQNNTSKTLRNLIALSLLPGFGPKRVKQLIQRYPEADRLFDLSKSELRMVEGIGEASALTLLSFDDWEAVEAVIERSNRIKSSIITMADPDYPALLKQIYDPPILLWLKGNKEVISTPGIAVIGTRNTTSYGRKMATKLTGELTNTGLTIYSGLAYGIDAIAHETALQQEGKTVAVLGSGIDRLYPEAHAELANNIVKKGGAVITEFSPGTAPDAVNFPVRNRIVSGLSYGTLVVESGIQGGSIITANLALDQNREVFAVPHSLNNLSGSGCNYLIKTGAAKLIQTVDDILEELPFTEHGVDTDFQTREEVLHTESGKMPNWKTVELSDVERKICEQLEQGEMQIDALADILEVSTSELLVAMLTLEMQHLVAQKAGKIFSLK